MEITSYSVHTSVLSQLAYPVTGFISVVGICVQQVTQPLVPLRIFI